MPRSLAYCYEKITSNLGYVGQEYGERLAAHHTADAVLATLKTTSIDQIMDQGLHEFLDNFISLNNKLGNEITEGYRFYS